MQASVYIHVYVKSRHTRTWTHPPSANTKPTKQIGKAVLASNLPLDAPKHIFLMLYMLTDRRDPQSFFKARRVSFMFIYMRMYGLVGWIHRPILHSSIYININAYIYTTPQPLLR